MRFCFRWMATGSTSFCTWPVAVTVEHHASQLPSSIKDRPNTSARTPCRQCSQRGIKCDLLGKHKKTEFEFENGPKNVADLSHGSPHRGRALPRGPACLVPEVLSTDYENFSSNVIAYHQLLVVVPATSNTRHSLLLRLPCDLVMSVACVALNVARARHHCSCGAHGASSSVSASSARPGALVMMKTD